MARFDSDIFWQVEQGLLQREEALALLRHYHSSGCVDETGAIHWLRRQRPEHGVRTLLYCGLTGREFFIADHKVNGTRVLPAVAYLELIRAAVEVSGMEPQPGFQLTDLSLEQPLALDADEERLLVVELTATEDRVVKFTLASTSLSLADIAGRMETQRPKEGDALAWGPELTIHCTGGYRPEPLKASIETYQPILEGQALQEFDAEACYRFLAASGFEYGARQRALRRVALQSEHQLLAQLAVPHELTSSLQHMLLHPSLLDSALQAAIGFYMADAGSDALVAGLPFAIDKVDVWRSCEPEMLARVTRHAEAQGATTSLDVSLYNAHGQICVEITGLTSRVTQREAARKDELLLAHPVWHPAPLKAGVSRDHRAGHHRIVLLGDFSFGGVPHRTGDIAHALKACWPADVPPPEVEQIGLDGQGVADDFTSRSLQLKTYLQDYLSSPPQEATILQVVVDGVLPFAQGAHAMLMCVAKEYPTLIPRLVSWNAGSSIAEMAEALAGEVIHGGANYVRYVPKRAMKHWETLAVSEPEPVRCWRDRGRYLITGGLGHLGLTFARDIATTVESPCIILLGRRSLDAIGEAERERMQSMRADGAEVFYYSVDVADEQALQDLIRRIEQDHGRLHGVLHAAGVVEDGLFADKTTDSWKRVIDPKVQGAATLHKATRDMPLDLFVLFSSGSAVFGNAGQADYAAANAFMAEYAAWRQIEVANGHAYGKSLCIHWPLWDGGMTVSDGQAERMYRETGMSPMRAAEGIEGLYRGLATDYTELLVATGDKDRLAQHLVQDPPQAGDQAVYVDNPEYSHRDDARVLSGAKRLLQQVIAGTLKLSMQQLRTDQPLDQYGIDSVDMMKMTRDLEKTFGTLPKTLFFQYPTVDELAGYFSVNHASKFEKLLHQGQLPTQRRILTSEARQERPVAAVPEQSKRTQPAALPIAADVSADSRADIAIIGLSGRYPMAKDVIEFWNNLANGVDAITEIPEGRWDWKAFFRSEGGNRPGAHASKWGGFIAGADEFDPLFFNISPSEAEIMDPQERLFLQHAWMALEDAGYCRSGLGRSRRLAEVAEGEPATGDVGVYAGVMYSEYIQCANNDPEQLVGSSYASIANRVSYVLDLRGPSITIDTMCSSSLTCLHLACGELASGGINMALVGGVNLNLHPNKYHLLSRGHFISPRGRCHSFGAEADGYVPSEGVGVLCLKRLADAERDGDQIYAVVKGSAINHGGKGQGYSVPQPQRQRDVIRQALKQAGVDARSVSYVEAHGTGTSLGDPIEISGLSQAFSRGTQEKQYCAIGSVKSNVGHCEAAAGMAALTKVIGQMRAGELFPSLHAQQLNSHIDFTNSPFDVVRERRAWDGWQQERIAGISSFGAGGSNAHVLLQEYTLRAEVPSVGEPGTGSPCLIPLSARTQEQLRLQVRQLVDYLEDGGQASAKDWMRPLAALENIAYTLQVGREPWEERLAFIAHSREEFRALLEGYLAGRPDELKVFSGGQGTSSRLLPLLVNDRDIHELIDSWFAKQKYVELLTVWVEGVDLDWARLYADMDAGRGSPKPHRVSLPTYPFAEERHWLPARGNGALAMAKPGAGEVLQKAGTVEDPADPRLGFMVPEWEHLPVSGSAEGISNPGTHLFLCGWSAEHAEQLSQQWPEERCQIIASDASEIDRSFADIALQLLGGLQRLLKDFPKSSVRVQVAVPAGSASLLSALEAMLRSIAMEHPTFDGQLIELEYDPAKAAADDLRRQVDRSKGYAGISLIRYRDQLPMRRVWRDAPDMKAEDVPWRENGVYLITGGSGALGSLLAQQMGRDAASIKLILVGRRPTSEVADSPAGIMLAQMRDRGIDVEYRSADITQLADCEELVAAVEQAHGVIHGVFHAAGVARDGTALRKTAAEFTSVLSPKVSGTVNLDLATRHLTLDFFILYSSLAGAMGNAGQSDYATANAFMDCYAAYRNQLRMAGLRHGRTISINWPGWQAEGMSLNEHAERVLREQVGMEPLGIDEGMRALKIALALDSEQVLVIYGDTEKMRRAVAAGSQAMEEEGAVDDETDPVAISEIPLLTSVTDRLRELLGRLCKLSPQRINPLAPLENYGVDSVKIIHLQQGLNQFFADVGTAVLYEHTTLASLAEYLVARHPMESRGWAGSKGAAAPKTGEQAIPAEPVQAVVASVSQPSGTTETSPNMSTVPEESSSDELIAIIGIAGRYPKASNIDEYWQNLIAGRDCIDVIPADRWSLEGFFLADKEEAARKGRSYSKWGGFIDGFADFDPQFFSIAPRDAYLMDPQERLFLQCAWEALEDAGHSREALARDYGKRVGVFVGATKTGFELYGPEFWRQGKAFLPRTSFGSIANRVSFCLDLTGPSLAIDTMCSSSLVALHEACGHLQRGSCDIAIAGGVNLYLHPANYISLCSGHMLSSEGRCKSFGAGGDGFVPGEGVGAVILKPLARAQRDGDSIHAVIRGSGINHTGRTHGYMVPSPAAQYALISETLAKAGCDAGSISYIEAHGTGTALGDPIEFRGITRAFGADGADGKRHAVGSVKSNIGHLEAAAGIAALTKVVLQLRHRKLVPTLHSRETNPEIDLADSAFYLPHELQDWLVDPATRAPLRAGISSFGAGGVNAHLIVEEYADVRARPAVRSDPGAPSMFILSARNADRLDAYLDRMIDFLSEGDCQLADLCLVLQTGRSVMAERCGFVCNSTSELLEALRSHRQGQHVAGFYRQRIGENTTAEDWLSLHAERSFQRIVQAWVQGADIPWQDFHASLALAERPRKMRVPSYPFKQQRFWLDTLAAPLALKTEGAPEQSSVGPTLASAMAEQQDRQSLHEILAPGIDQRDGRPREVHLRPPGEIIPANGRRMWRQIVLSDPASGPFMAGARSVPGQDDLADHLITNQTFGLTIDANNNALAHVHLVSECTGSALVAQLTEIFERSLAASAESSESAIKVVIVHGPNSGLHHSLSGLVAEAVDGMLKAMRNSPWVILSAFHGDAVGLGWLLGTASDLLVVNEASNYGCTTDLTGQSAFARQVLGARFGNRRGVETMLAGEVLSGEQWQSRNIGLHAAPAPKISAEVAAAIEALLKAGHAGSLLKAHWRNIFSVDALRDPAWSILPDPLIDLPAAYDALDLGRLVSLPYSCVELTINGKGVATLRLQDRTTKNAFTPELVAAMEAAMAWVEETDACKVLIITGYDTYFASGGTREGLQAIQQGRAKFTDARLYELPLKCSVPVIAAMQGHAIGAGWSMGLFCDAVFFAEQSVYHCPYVSYGFTPGAGSTLVFPMRLGLDLGREILLSAQPYKGLQLRQRLPGLPVFPRNQVLARAHGLAEQWAAQGSRDILISEKQQRLAPLAQKLPTVIREELAMHEKTFYHNPAVARLIDISYGLGAHGVATESVPAVAQEAASEARQRLGSVLKKTLAAEIQLDLDELDEHASFVDLGLDSVTAVTWARNLRQQLSLELSPAQIYQNPSLAKLLEYLLEHSDTASSPLAAPVGEHAPALKPLASPAVAKIVRQVLANELQLDEDEIDAYASFVDLGLDSVTAVIWTRKLNELLSTQLSPTQLYQHSTLTALTEYLEGRGAAFSPDAPAGPPERREGEQWADATSAGVSSPALAVDVANEVSRSFDGAGVVQSLAKELQLAVTDIDSHATFVDLGLDSVTAITWSKALAVAYGVELRASHLYQYPSVSALTGYLSKAAVGTPSPKALSESKPLVEHGGVPSQGGTEDGTIKPGASFEPVPPRIHSAVPPEVASIRAKDLTEAKRSPADVRRETAFGRSTDIAIIGMAGRFPKAVDIDAFWRNLVEGVDCISEVPESRWSLEKFYDPDPQAKGKTSSRWMGLLEDMDAFDAEFFNISPREAENMDPQQRVFMENCWHAIEHAGYNPLRLANQRCGVFVGCATGDYANLCPSEEAGAQAFTGGSSSILSARMPYFLNLNGPCLAIDTACSSALVAVNEACNSLLLGNCDLAIAGGVCVMAGPTLHILSSKAGMLSPQGRCRTFDNAANGFVPGEGVGTVILRRLEDAVAEGDTIYGVIRGWGTNQDGKTNGITAPNPEAQRRLVSEIYRRFDIDPKQISLVEAHGTGTKLGDPIEVGALTQAFNEFGAGTGYCALGSVKSNIGHLALAAGVAGLIKVLLSLQYRQIPPTLHCDTVNEHIDLDRSPFYIPREAREWDVPGKTRMACVSSFGFSGTNAHMVVEEYRPDLPRSPEHRDGGRHLVVLSARRPEQLKSAASRLRDHLISRKEAGSPPDLVDVAYTLQTGRAGFKHRLAIVASSIEDLADRLDRWQAGDHRNTPDQTGVYQGAASLSNDPERSAKIQQALAAGDHDRAASLWIAGGDIDVGTGVYQNLHPRRIALPGYAFARQRHWFDLGKPVVAASLPKTDIEERNGEPRKKGKRIAVVGAGPAGLVMAKSLLEEGHVPVVFDRQSDLGGVWLLQPDNKQAGAYKKVRFQTSKYTSIFSDFSGPSGGGHFYGVADMHRYLSAYAEQFNLSPHISYRTEVTKVAPYGDQWKVTTVRNGEVRTDIYDGVALCQGLYWKPSRPDFVGLSGFQGQIMHSGAYFDEECLRGKRVLVVGNGISGMDIAEEATKSATKVYWTMRRPKFIMPRMTGFVPNDFQSPASLLADVDPAQMLERIRYSMPDYYRQYQNSGLLPNLDEFRKQPVVQINDAIIQMVANGQVEAIVDDISEFHPRGCRFKRSQRDLDVDVVVFCTGYAIDEYLDPLPGVSMRKDFAMGIFYRDNPSLVSTSCPLPVAFSGTFFFPEMVARWYARVMSGSYRLHDSELGYSLDHRHGAINGPIASVLFGLKLGLLPDPKREFKAFWQLVNLPSFPPIYRLQGEHSDPEAGNRLQELRKRNLTNGKQAAALEAVKHRILAGFDDAVLRDLLARGEIAEHDYRSAAGYVKRAIVLDWQSQYVMRGDDAAGLAIAPSPKIPKHDVPDTHHDEQELYRKLLGQLKAGELDKQGLLKALAI
ncbi:SDR family NAD(P)-dependent oxidoreductase [Agrobacterium rhizogenes]|uniref:SDR family NAD(P)-dependent oxidoreductase n=1 Tax=Rhizobium rhizogenes TaxID=359 RepID=UPI001571FDA1|nr:SDR family NAD(P)-dependent oxidoreductase [Rhizobium rhizogenes]NTG51717.1 SDR family NAD(P)-dependent oxidoreductase [Rhizobium rhizogenes]